MGLFSRWDKSRPTWGSLARLMLADGLRDNVIILIAAGVDELPPSACQGIYNSLELHSYVLFFNWGGPVGPGRSEVAL